MKQIPVSERPRERLLRDGVQSLSLAELIAVLLGTGMRGKSVLFLAQELIDHFGGLQGLLEASVEELTAVKGMGRAKALLLKAAFGIALRASRETSSTNPLIRSAREAFEVAKNEIGHQPTEELMVILRDARGRMIHFERIGIGTLSEVLVHPREVFHPAVRHRAHSLILAHNHPSGDPTPSQADLDLTRLLLQSSKVMGIGFDDHLIIGANNFISLKEKGYLGVNNTY